MVQATRQQSDAIEAAAKLDPGKAMKIIAYAGAGKTFTLQGIAKARRDRGIYLAFNKVIAEEARRKLASTKCGAKTIHAIAYRVVIDVTGEPIKFRANDVVKSRVIEAVRRPDLREWTEQRCAIAALRTVSTFCNSADPNMDVAHAEQALRAMVGDPDFLNTKAAIQRAQAAIEFMTEPVLAMAEAWWAHCMRERICNHDMYLKVLDVNPNFRNAAFGSFDYVLCDEAQDLNPVQRSILTKTGLPIIAVGDSYQSIYAWRGAEDALNEMSGEAHYLTQSFRFGENIASIARDILDGRPDATPEHPLEGIGPMGDYPNQKSRKAIICRTNIGVINEALECARLNQKFRIENIDTVFSDLESALALKNRRQSAIKNSEFQHYESWDEFKAEAEAGTDQSMMQLVRLIEDNRVQDVKALSKANTNRETPDTVNLTTIHKSKGSEWETVRMGDDCRTHEDMLERYAVAQTKSKRHIRQAIEEFNATYVGVTRAIRDLENHERLMPQGPARAPTKAAAQ